MNIDKQNKTKQEMKYPSSDSTNNNGTNGFCYYLFFCLIINTNKLIC
jgi:hypothetical protein